MNWSRNGKQLTKRKAIRAEARKRLDLNHNDQNAYQVYEWAHGKIRRFYDVVPLDDVWPINKK